MKNRLNAIVSSLTVAAIVSIPTTAKAYIVYGNSVLCSNRGWNTQVALATDKFNVAVCKSSRDNFHYVGQDKNTNEGVVLPLRETYSTGNGMVYKAVNGRYTYQIFTTCEFTQGDNNWATLAVFDNGARLRHDRLDRYMNNVPACMNSSLFDIAEFKPESGCGLYLYRKGKKSSSVIFNHGYEDYGLMALDGSVRRLTLKNSDLTGDKFEWSFATQDNATRILIDVDSVLFHDGEVHDVEGYIKLTRNSQDAIVPVEGSYGC